MIQYKTCSKCKRELECSGDYFAMAKNGKYGFASICKSCYKEWREKNKEKIKPKDKEYYKKNKEKFKNYYEKNKEKILEKIKEYKKNNRKKVNEINKKYKKKNYENNKEKIKEYYENNKEKIKEYRKNNIKIVSERNKRYRENNKEKIKETEKKWREKNKEKLKEYARKNIIKNKIRQHNRRVKIRSSLNTLTTQEWQHILKKFDNSCCYCGSKDRIEMEHFVPVKKGGDTTYRNIIPACKSCNCSKGARSFFKWYPKQTFYSKKREQKILSHLNYYGNYQQLAIV